ncbi:serine O-acetyltransferase EpsC [Mesotoga sp. UBA5557]|uniref:serine O-acetyltransferase EpsC n=1 Tax=Mesotoga sp. UBA5557 TaxID=1946857 RepID=UPI000A62D006|nr:serine O-acetyltransferase EpsC [Mesotoga sp. UBA5557]
MNGDFSAISVRISGVYEEIAKTHCSSKSYSLGNVKLKTIELIHLIRRTICPQLSQDETTDGQESLMKAMRLLEKLILDIQPHLSEEEASSITSKFLDGLPTVAKKLVKDVRAAYEGDPAAQSVEEIMIAYPAYEAISIYRLAHILYSLKVPLIPRIMTEYAHQKTGIDIHPGARIGTHFFIDHGTGVVIGETCRIGDHVKIYQGVTLGAKSFELDENGNPIKGIKRHPDIGNHVVIYAGATVLGGSTVVGDNCVIGGNVWLVHSLKPGEKIYSNP